MIVLASCTSPDRQGSLPRELSMIIHAAVSQIEAARTDDKRYFTDTSLDEYSQVVGTATPGLYPTTEAQ